ncbi:hypothetical protein D9M68_627180 [compost metagenome]
MPAVGQQAIGDIQRRRGLAAQRLPQRQLWLRRPVTCQQRLGDRRWRLALAEHQRQSPRAIAQLPCDAEQIADLRPRTSQRLAPRYTAKHREGQAQRAATGIAADQAHRAVLRHLIEAPGEGLQPGRFGARHGQRQGEADRRRAHGGQVADRHAQGALAEQERIRSFGEMHPGNQGVGGHRQLLASRHLQQGAVVADAKRHTFAGLRTGRSGEVVTDQLELTQGRQHRRD